IKSLNNVSRAADQLVRSLFPENIGCYVGDPRQSALSRPANLPRLLVQCHNDRLVPRFLPPDLLIFAIAASVKRNDEEILIQDWRDAQAMLTVKLEIAVPPDDYAGHGKRRQTAIAKGYVDPLAVSDRSWSGIGISVLLAAGILLYNLCVPKQLSRQAIQTD